MSYVFTVFLLLAQTAQTAVPGQNLQTIVDGVERTFARMNDLSADFVQISQDLLNRKLQSAGHLYLKRPRMMRWNYEPPERQEYVSDGKTVYSYIPADRQVSRAAVRNTADDRIPLMFLLGQANLRDEFTRFETLSTKPFLEGTKVIKMYPKRKSDLQDLIMEVDPNNYQIRRLILGHSDGTREEFIFSNIVTNKGLPDSLFKFVPPPGVQVVDGGGR
jgi:outer membrane lipoprotein carrier protein